MKTLEETIEALLMQRLNREISRAGIPEAGVIVRTGRSGMSGYAGGMGGVFSDIFARLAAKRKKRQRAAKRAVPVLARGVANAKAGERRAWGLWNRYRLRPRRAAEYKDLAAKEKTKARAVAAGLKVAKAEAVSPTITAEDIRVAAKPAIKDLATVMAREFRGRVLSSKRAVGKLQTRRERATQDKRYREVTSDAAESFYSSPEWNWPLAMGSDVEEGAEAFGQDIDTAVAVFGQDIDTAAAVFGQAGSEIEPYADF